MVTLCPVILPTSGSPAMHLWHKTSKASNNSPFRLLLTSSSRRTHNILNNTMKIEITSISAFCCPVFLLCPCFHSQCNFCPVWFFIISLVVNIIIIYSNNSNNNNVWVKWLRVDTAVVAGRRQCATTASVPKPGEPVVIVRLATMECVRYSAATAIQLSMSPAPHASQPTLRIDDTAFTPIPLSCLTEISCPPSQHDVQHDIPDAAVGRPAEESLSMLPEVYDEVVHGQKWFFKLPTGSASKRFVALICKQIPSQLLIHSS